MMPFTYRGEKVAGPGMRENHQVEWKSSWDDGYLRWICGADKRRPLGGHKVIPRFPTSR